MTKVVHWFSAQHHRAYLYRVLAGLGVVAVGAGYVTDTQAALWLGFVATLLGTGTAAANTSTKRNEYGAVNWLAVIAICAVLIVLLMLGFHFHVGRG